MRGSSDFRRESFKKGRLGKPVPIEDGILQDHGGQLPAGKKPLKSDRDFVLCER
jgi:hypothetical protein